MGMPAHPVRDYAIPVLPVSEESMGMEVSRSITAFNGIRVNLFWILDSPVDFANGNVNFQYSRQINTL